MDDFVKGCALIGVIFLFYLALIFIGPIFSIWSINTLFRTEIAFNFTNWCAMAWLHLIIAGSSLKFKKNNNEAAQE